MALQQWAKHDEFQLYMANVQPVFNSLNSLTGVTAGLLLLGQRRIGFQAMCEMPQLPHEIAIECLHSLRSMKVPGLAKQHHQHLKQTAKLISDIAGEVTSAIADRQPLYARTDGWCRSLESACRMLRCSSNPLLGLSTVNFADGCACCMPVIELNDQQQ